MTECMCCMYSNASILSVICNNAIFRSKPTHLKKFKKERINKHKPDRMRVFLLDFGLANFSTFTRDEGREVRENYFCDLGQYFCQIMDFLALMVCHRERIFI